MQRKKYLLSLSFAAILSLAGCGGNPQSGFSSSGGSQSQNSDSSSNVVSGSSSKQGGNTSQSSNQGGNSSSTSNSSAASSSSWEGTTMPTTQDIVLMCAKNTGYNHVYAWVTAQNVLTAVWPGDTMEEYDDDWYCYRFTNPSVTAFSVIFNNGNGAQTADLTDVVNGAGYYWFTKADGFIASQEMPNPGGGSAPVTDMRTIEGPGDYTGGTATAATYRDFTFWNTYPNSYWTTINKYNGSRKDFRQESIYFAITTRFYDGDPSNNAECWDNQHNPPSDPAWRGDFKGLIEKMDYIKALGFTAIWITPIVSNASGYDYHGYHSMNFKQVDTRYESEDVDFQTVINEAHKRDMKIVLDVVFNHTGNFGDETLFPMFIKDTTANPDDINAEMQLNLNGPLYKKYPNYASMPASQQYQARIETMKSADGDPDDIYHHYGNFSWETQGEQVAQIAGDCVDLNTENPRVAEFLVDSYGKFIRMGVDAFRIDTMKHINRLTLNNYFFPALREYAQKCRGDDNFFMFGEVCARVTELYNHGIPALSPSFYTWKEEKNYAWGDKETNYASAEQNYNDYREGSSDTRTTNNAYLGSGYSYHTPDHSQWNGNSVIDFRMHRSLGEVDKAYNDACNDDGHFNDATYNVTYVDSHDYAPEPQDLIRPTYSESEWAEKLNLIFTFRGIPCMYYGTEVRLNAGKEIDKGSTMALSETGRAYFGDYLDGTVSASGFGTYSASGKANETLGGSLAKHIQMLNKIRLQVPALQMGQYASVGNKAFVRRYTANGTDSVACVVISGSQTFSGLPNGTYVDLVTGDTKTGTSFTASANGQGNIRVYVKDGRKVGGSNFAK